MSKLQALLTIAAVLCVGTTAEAQCQNGVCGVGQQYNSGFAAPLRSGNYGYSQFRPRVEYTGAPWSFSQACRECGCTTPGYQTGNYAPGRYQTNRFDSSVCRDCNDSNCRCDLPGTDYRSNYRPMDDYRPINNGYGTNSRPRFDDRRGSDFGRYDDFRTRDLDRNYRPRTDYPDLRFPDSRTQDLRYNYTSTGRTNVVRWQTDLRRAAEQARAERRPMVVVFGADWCTYCKRMKAETFSDSRFIREVNRAGFIPVQVDADKNQETVARLGIRSLPTTLIVGSDLKIAERVQGFKTASQMTQILTRHGRSAELDVDVKVAAK